MGIPLLTSGEACSGPGPGRKQWEQRRHSHSHPEGRSFLKSATPGAPWMPSPHSGGHAAVQIMDLAAPRYNAGRWALGADGPKQDNGRGKAEGEPRERTQEEQEEWEGVAFPYNRGRQQWKDLRDQLAKSFTVFKKTNFMQKHQYIGAVLVEATLVGFPTIYSP